MEIYILISFVWLIGGLYACGVHHANKEAVREHGKSEDIDMINKGGYLQYVLIFFMWPHYLGYIK